MVRMEATDRDVFVIVASPDTDVSVSVDTEDFIGFCGGRREFAFLSALIVFVQDEEHVCILVFVINSSAIFFVIVG